MEYMKQQSYKKATREERKIIIDCYEKIQGEFYTVLGLNNDDDDDDCGPTIEDIKLACDKANLNELYEILMNPRLKQIYDNEFYDKIIEFNNKSNKKVIIYNSLLLSLIFEIGSYPFEDFSTLIGSKFGIIKSIIDIPINSSKLFKYFLISFIPMTPIALFSGFVTFSTNLLFNNNDDDEIKELTQNILNKLFIYPISFTLRTILISPISMSIIQILKNVLLRNDSSPNCKLFQWSNLFYAIIPSITIQLTKDLIIEKFIKKYCNNNNNNKKGGSPYFNSIIEVILTTLLTFPLSVIEYQYNGEFVQSYLNGTSIPIVLNPISMAIKIYKQQTFKKFYNGILFNGIYNFLITLSLHFSDKKIYYFDY